MAKAKAAKNIRLLLGILFLTFLLFNAVFQTLAVIAELHQKEPVRIFFSEDTSPGIRLLLFFIGIGASWLLSRMLFKLLIKGNVRVGDSTDTAYVLGVYLLLTFATACFISVISWFWLPVLFLVLLIYSVLALWKLVGGPFTGGAVALTFITIICIWYVAS